MKIVELIIDEENEYSGIEAISIVESPAIEENFVALKDQKEYKFQKVDQEKKILMGPLLIPNKPIFRKGREDEDDYYIYFTRETVKKASELFLKNKNQSNSTLEHLDKIQGLTLVESWIVEDSEKDKSALYGMELPLGTWAGSIKVDNEEIWSEYVKTGKVKGFSIEGYFADKSERPKENIEEDLSKEIEIGLALLDLRHKIARLSNVQLKTYKPPQSVRNNAKRGIELNEKQNNKCATQTGKVRAQQLVDESVSLQTVKRMYSYLSRAETYYDPNETTKCGTISYLLWGGKSGLSWSRNILRKEGLLNLKDPCWKGYQQVGTKIKDGRKVPNCVPIKRKAK